MIHYLKPSFWRASVRDPLTWLALAVDFFPVILVLFFGWRAAPLVLLYWAENIIIGVVTFFRIIAASVQGVGPFGIFLAAFMCAFFTLHYGIFCFVHGVFLFSFVGLETFEDSFIAVGPGAFGNMLEAIVINYPAALWAMGLILVYQAVVAIVDYWPGSRSQQLTPQEEMMSPYGRIVVLHFGLFVGMAALFAIGDPAVGVLVLIGLRMAFSVIGRAMQDRKRAQDLSQQ